MIGFYLKIQDHYLYLNIPLYLFKYTINYIPLFSSKLLIIYLYFLIKFIVKLYFKTQKSKILILYNSKII
jgi:hypothetical protein